MTIINYYDKTLISNLLDQTDPAMVEIVKKKKAQIIEEIDLRGNSPEGINVPAIKLIHRTHQQSDGFIAFASLESGSFNDLAGIRSSELDKLLTNVKCYLDKDGRFTINNSYRHKFYKSTITGLNMPLRKEADMRYLNACYLDIDFYKKRLNFDQSLTVVLLAVEKKVIPQPSFICYSGRGMYLMWSLKKDHSNKPVQAYEEKVKQYKKANRYLAIKLAGFFDLGIDSGAYDAARYLRVPGSKNSTSGHRVVYCPQHRDDGRLPIYTLDALYPPAEKKKVKSDIVIGYQSAGNIRKKKSYPNRVNGYRAVAEHVIKDLLIIEKDIGGFQEGIRRKTLTIVAFSGRRAGYTKKKIISLLDEIAGRCQPAYPSEANDTTVKNIVDGIWSAEMINYRSEYLADKYEISAEKARRLNLKTIKPDKLERKLTRSDNQVKRRTKIREIFTASKKPPTIRKVKELLGNDGINASLSTIHQDINQEGLIKSKDSLLIS